MNYIEAIILGALQGVTEFLPISSTGHLVFARELMGLVDQYALTFDAILHVATAVAVLVYFSRSLGELTQTALRKLGRLPVNKKDETLLYAVLLGTIPAVCFGLLLESIMETAFRNLLLVASVMFLGSLLFMYAEWKYYKEPRHSTIDIPLGIKVGLFQVLALIPGMSRAGATIAGGMILGLSRHDATHLSFLLAIPIVVGAGSKKLLELLLVGNGEVDWFVILAGSVMAFITALGAIHWLVRFLQRYTLWVFVWYRILFAVLVTFFVLLGP